MKGIAALVLVALLSVATFAQGKRIEQSYDKFKNYTTFVSDPILVHKKPGMEISFVLVYGFDGQKKVAPEKDVILIVVESLIRYDEAGDLDILRDGASNQ